MPSAFQSAADHEEAPEYKYWAFISYSHQDEKWAAWLHKGLETYRVPQRLVGREERDFPVPKKIFPVFRDREECPPPPISANRSIWPCANPAILSLSARPGRRRPYGSTRRSNISRLWDGRTRSWQ